MVSKKLPPKQGARLALYHGDSKLLLRQTMQEQGIVCKDAILSCTFLPTDLYAAWCLLKQRGEGPDREFALEGVTRLENVAEGEHLYNLPKCLESLTLTASFKQNLVGVTLICHTVCET